MPRQHDCMPVLIAQTGGNHVEYCPLCNSPVVDHPDAFLAHDVRIHPERARCAPLFMSESALSHIAQRVSSGVI